jgi:DNA-binding transcriptional LysR family regulator
MNDTNIGSVDLNLLKAFAALLRERSVTRAAQAIGLSQPALSHALARLRGLFADDLFVRLPHGMEPTPRALELGELVQAALEQIRQALELGRGFDPGATTRIFALGAAEHAEIALVGGLAERVTARASHADLRILPVDFTNMIERLDDNRISVAIDVLRDPPKHYPRRLLYRESAVVIGRRDDPALARIGSPVTYAGAAHLAVAPAGRSAGGVDAVLAELGLQRRLAVTVATYLAVPSTLRRTRLIATLPLSTALHLMRLDPDLAMAELPFLPRFDVSMIWHPRHDGDPAERWLRALLAELGAAVAPGDGVG